MLRRDVVVPALERVLRGEPAERVVDKALRGLTREERRAAADAIFGVALWQRRLRWQTRREDAAALLDAYEQGMEPVPPQLADRYSLPDWILEKVLRDVPDPEAFLQAINQRGPICLRANRLKCTREEL